MFLVALIARTGLAASPAPTQDGPVVQLDPSLGTIDFAVALSPSPIVSDAQGVRLVMEGKSARLGPPVLASSDEDPAQQAPCQAGAAQRLVADGVTFIRYGHPTVKHHEHRIFVCGLTDRVVAILPVDLVFRDVDVFDPAIRALIPDQDVAVAGGLIVAVGDLGDHDTAEVIDGQGGTLLPGFVDAHIHLGTPLPVPGKLTLPDPERTLQACLSSGVTTVLDMGGMMGQTEKLRQKGRAGEIPAPTIFGTTPPITTKGGHPIPASQELLPWPVSKLVKGATPQAEGPEDAVALVQEVVDGGGDYVKVIRDSLPPGTPQMQDATLQALVDAGHASGLEVYIHVGDEDDALTAIRAGADALVHMPYTGLSEEAALEIAAAGIPVVATLSAFRVTRQITEGTWQPSAHDRRLWPAETLDPWAGNSGIENFGSKPTLGAFGDSIAEDLSASLLRLHHAGVPILVGTDASVPGIYPGSAYSRELIALVDAGMSPAEALWGATLGGTTMLLPVAGTGRIADGAVADLVLVDGDPLQDIAVVADPPRLVLRGGQKVLPAE